jgi:hypothetical protein
MGCWEHFVGLVTEKQLIRGSCQRQQWRYAMVVHRAVYKSQVETTLVLALTSGDKPIQSSLDDHLGCKYF